MNLLSVLGLEAWALRLRAAVLEGAIAVEDRMALARLEWADQKQRLQWLLVLAVLTLGLTVVALLMLSAATVVHFWDTPHRVTAAWLLAALWMLLWAAGLAGLWMLLQRSGRAFALTRRELSQDWQDLKERL